MTGRQDLRRFGYGIRRGAGAWASLWLALWLVPAAAQALLCTAQTPEQAVQQWQRAQGDGVQISAEEWRQPLGYAVVQVVRDPILGQAWAQVQDCAHPSRPLVAIALPKQAAAHTAARKATVLVTPSTHAEASASVVAPSVWAAQMPHASLPQLPGYRPLTVRMAQPQAAQAYPTSAPVLVRAGDRVTLWNREPDLQMNLAAIALEYGRAGQVIHLRRTSGFGQPEETIAGVVRAAGSVELLP